MKGLLSLVESGLFIVKSCGFYITFPFVQFDNKFTAKELFFPVRNVFKGEIHSNLKKIIGLFLNLQIVIIKMFYNYRCNRFLTVKRHNLSYLDIMVKGL